MRGLPGLLLFFLLAAPACAQTAPGPFFLHDGDTVVFYGDSITEQQRYTRDIETFVVTRFPTWHVKFINSGWNGDRASGGAGGSAITRLKRDVLPYQPTVVTLSLGMNDGAYTRFDPAVFDAYTKGMTTLVDTLVTQLPGVRLTLLTPTYYDEYAPYSRHFHGYNAVMVRYGDFIKQLGAERNIPVVDCNAPLRAATKEGRKRDVYFTLAVDGVHPTEAGHLILAAALLQAWGAPGAVADITLDPAHPVKMTDTALPWPMPAEARRAQGVSPLPATLNVFRATAPGVKSGEWEMRVDGKKVGTFTAAELQAGLDLAALPGLPQNAQAADVLGRVQDRCDRWRYLWKGNSNAIARRSDLPADTEIAALLAVDHWLDDAREQTRVAAQPRPHTLALRRMPDPSDSHPMLKLPTLKTRRHLR